MELDMIDTLSERQKEFLLEYVTTNNITKSCKVCGISRTTAYEYLKQDMFCKAMEELRAKKITSSWYLLSSNLEMAVNRLIEILNSKDTSVNAKLRAIQLLFEYTEKYQDRVEILDKIKNLEERMNVS